MPTEEDRLQGRTRALAYLALEACTMAQRLVPRGLDPVMDMADEPTRDVEAAVSDAFEASGLKREIPDDFMGSAIDAAGGRLKDASAVVEADS